MGVVGVRDDGKIEIVVVGGDAEEIQCYKGLQKEEYIQVDEGGGFVGQLRQK